MSIPWRLSVVGTLAVDTLLFSAVVQVGDNDSTRLFNRTIAMHRAIPRFHGDETRFAAYSIFFRPLPSWGTPPQMLEISGPAGAIRVGSVRVITLAASSLVRIGSGRNLEAESRIKHIRHYNHLAPGSLPQAESSAGTDADV
jgi:spore germination protein PE